MLDEMNAKVEIMGIQSSINIQLIEEPKIGDYVLVHAGCAIQRINAAYFDFLRETYREFLHLDGIRDE